MRKQSKIILLIISVAVLVFSRELYARALHFVVYGDTRREIKTIEKPQVKHNAIARVIRSADPDFILFSGDMVCYNEFDKFLEVVTNNYVGGKAIPLYPVIGNHELVFGEKVDALINDLFKKAGIIDKPEEQVSSQSGLLIEIEKIKVKLHQEIESIVETGLKKRSRQVLCKEICDKLGPAYISYLKDALCKTTNEQSWYSFVKEVNGLQIKFIALNSSLPDDEEQFQWFRDELKYFSGPKIIFEHYPPYSIGFHGCIDLQNDKSKAARFRDRYTKFFNDGSHNIVLVISGHEHNYQRLCKTDTTGSLLLPVYIVSGGGGAELMGRWDCAVSQIPLDGYQCPGLITAYHFIDVVADTDDKNNLILKCKTRGLRYDLAKGLPDDAAFEKQFVEDRLELIDDFTLRWQK